MLLGWFLLFRPTVLGGPASYVIVSGQSMAPTLQGSDLAVLQKRSDYRPGDIIAFRVPEGQPGEGFLVVHRIVGGSAEDGFVMQGDNKEQSDLWRPNADDIEGRMWFSVPGGGRLLVRLLEPLTVGLLAGGLGMLTVLGGGQKSKRRLSLSADPEDG